jgi:hypothetical protein
MKENWKRSALPRSGEKNRRKPKENGRNSRIIREMKTITLMQAILLLTAAHLCKKIPV